MNPHKINVNKIDTFGIYELRELGRIVGVKSPTSLRRDDLIVGIRSRIESGDFGKNNPRGRRPLDLNFDFSKVVDSDVFNSYVKSILAQSSESGTAGESREVSGYVHLLPAGNAVLIGTDLHGYPVALKVLRANTLVTGDYVEAKVMYNASRNCFVVEEILKQSDGVRFDKLEGTRGERLLVVVPKPFDRIQEIANIADEMKQSKKIALLIDETQDSADFLRNSIHDTYVTKVNFCIQKQTMVCLLALFRAKEAAEQGESVVLFVDSFNKLFKIYNNSAYPDGCINPAVINSAPLVDLKGFFMSARALRNGGSLTVVGFLNYPENLIEDYAGGEGKYHHRMVMCDPDTGYQFTDIKEINILELKKLPKVDDGTDVWAWMKFLSADNKEELDMLVADRPNSKIGKAVVRLEELSQDERARMLFESRQMFEWDIKLDKELAIEAAVKEAVQDTTRIARNSTLHEVARNMLKRNRPLSEIAEDTGLSYAEIESMR